MTLERFSNRDNILATDGKLRGNKWTQELSDKGILTTQIVQTVGSSAFGDTLNIEAHIYSSDGDGAHVTSAYNIPFNIKDAENGPDGNNIAINVTELSKLIEIRSGRYNVVYNFHRDIVGNVSQKALQIKEVSSDRTEILLKPVLGVGAQLTNIRTEYLQIADVMDHFLSGNLVINFGKGNVHTILNQGTYESPDELRIKLLKPLNIDIDVDAYAWICTEVSDPYTDDIEFYFEDEIGSVYLRGPNFETDTRYSTVTETDFQNWNNLLGDNLPTSQKIVDTIFSGSLSGIKLGIDYSAFENFIQFSSAEERVRNFKYKLELVEFYNAQIGTLEGANGDDTGSLQKNIALASSRRNNVIGTFDGFERWLYYEPTASLFTHQTVYDDEHNSGNPTRLEGGVLFADAYQIQPYPKFISSSYGGGEYKVHHTSHSLSDAWFNGTVASASLYDIENANSLQKSIPEHIRVDENNSQYELFVNMIGHHYDILYSYIDAISKIYKPIEHPKLGHSKDVLYQVAESLGWTLTNGSQASDLWKYKLGTGESGSFASTGSIFSKADEDITTEVWRRIVNNLPYLLKTKGTARSIKALMNTYGIPQTLLSIREYGGPKVSGDEPHIIEDRFNYALQFKAGEKSRIHFFENRLSASMPPGEGFETWGPLYNPPPDLTTSDETRNLLPPFTREFRFKPANTSSMVLYNNILTDPVNSSQGSNTQMIAIEHTGSYSGSSQWGRLHYSIASCLTSITPNAAMVGRTKWLPLYNGDFWNISIGFTTTGDHYNTGSNTDTQYHVHVQQASDYIRGKIVHSGSVLISPTASNHYKAWSLENDVTDGFYNFDHVLGGVNTDDPTYLNAEESAGDFDAVETAMVGSMTQSHNNFDVLEYNFLSANDQRLHVRDVGVGLFTGSMQEYRSYMEFFDKNTFDIHTLNPTSYVSSVSATSSFDTLVRHYPLGTNLNAVDLSGNIEISSSHPAQEFQDFQPFGTFLAAIPSYFRSADTKASASNFPTPTNTQRGNFVPVEETYYIQGVSLGGTLPKSQKIRFDTNELVQRLTPEKSAERSKFDYSSLDSNKLGLFYSMADQINKDIFNHIGDVELDDYVGDPDDEYEFHYPDLHHFSKEYWKKYTDRNDVNAYMRIFSQFDFSLFNQIKQLLPERVDEAMGLIVEPHALERAKVRLTKPPTYTTPFYTGVVDKPAVTATGSLPMYSASIDKPVRIEEAEQIYHKGSSGYSEAGNYEARFANGQMSASSNYNIVEFLPGDEISMSPSASITAAYIVSGGFGAVGGQRNKYTPGENYYQWFGFSGSAKLNIDFLPDTVQNDANSKDDADAGAPVIATMASSVDNNVVLSPIRVQFDTYNASYDTIQDVHVRWSLLDQYTGAIASIQARLLLTEDNAHGEDFTIKNADILTNNADLEFIRPTEIASTQKITLDAPFNNKFKYSTPMIFKDVRVPARKMITVEWTVIWEDLDEDDQVNALFIIDGISLATKTKIVQQNFIQDIVDDFRPSTIFKKKVFHYGTGSFDIRDRYEISRQIYLSSSRQQDPNNPNSVAFPDGDYYSSSLQETNYREDENAGQDGLNFLGCQLTAPGINVNSGYIALGYSPIIEITEVNPNQIFYNDSPNVAADAGNTGNVTVTSGPAALTSVPATPPSPASTDPGNSPGPAQLMA